MSKSQKETRYTVVLDAYQEPRETASETEFEEALIAAGYTYGSLHPDRQAWLVDISCNTEEGVKWVANLTYTTNPTQEQRNQSDDPTSEAARVSWSGENFQEVAVVDKDDKPILNSAGDPYDPPLMKDFSRPVATVRKYVSSAPAWILDSHDKKNSTEFVLDGLTVPAGKAKIKRVDISDQPLYRNGVAYREMTIVIHFSKNGWVRKVLDAGFRRIYSGTSRENITLTNSDDQQEYPTAPVPLDGSGVELTDPTPTTCVYNSYDLDDTLDFNTLPLQ
jgi:hypothetical protein